MNTCDICLKVFKRRDNMLRHKKSSHGSVREDAEMESSGPETDEEITDIDDDVTSIHTVQDTYDPWESVMQRAFEKCDERFEEEVERLMKKRTTSQRAAGRRVYDDMRSMYRKAVMSIFTNRMTWFDAIRRDPIYKAIKRTATNLIELDDYDPTEAWKSAISQRKYLFDKVLEEYEAPDLSFNSDDDEDQADTEEEEEGEEEEAEDEDMEDKEPSSKRQNTA